VLQVTYGECLTKGTFWLASCLDNIRWIFFRCLNILIEVKVLAVFAHVSCLGHSVVLAFVSTGQLTSGLICVPDGIKLLE